MPRINIPKPKYSLLNNPISSKIKNPIINRIPNKPVRDIVVDSTSIAQVPLLQNARQIKRGNFLGLAANKLTSGSNIATTIGEAVDRGWKTANRASRLKKRRSIGFTRGFRTGLRKGWRNIGDDLTGNAFTAGKLAKGVLEASPYRNTKLGNTLLRPVSTFLPVNMQKRISTNRQRMRQFIRKSSGGIFNNPNFIY
jgi:hypothetical protein